MEGLLKVAEQLVINRLISNSAPVTGVTKARLALLGLSGFLCLVGATFFTIATYFWALSVYDKPTALFIVSGIMFVIAVLCVILYSFISYMMNKRIKETKEEAIKTAAILLEVANQELSIAVQKNPEMSMALATLAGWIAAKKVI